MSHLLNYTNDKQETILHLAVIHGTPRLIALLVAKVHTGHHFVIWCHNVILQYSRFLHMTLCSNQPSFVSIVKVISSVNMSHLLNYTNDKQETILHLAVIHGTPRLIALLVAKGKSLLPT
ncbi:Relish 1b [Operophtera brumata]|uniref:Relish 1b n=1 Tax=Operophtera brumata TaxID=104452 RepID=A0A0L7KSD2_OPEBR|nr:Relish 1b [Operophtera brumata]